MEIKVNCMILKSYTVTVEADTEEEALQKVRDMNSLEIAEEGKLKDVAVDYIEIA